MCLNHQFMVSPLLGWLLGPTFSEAARRDELRLHPTGRSWIRWNQFRWDPWGTPRKILQIGIIEDFQGGNSMYDNVCMSSFVAWRDSELEFQDFWAQDTRSDDIWALEETARPLWGLNPPWGPSSSTCYSSVDPMISNDWEYGPSERSKPIKCHSHRLVNPVNWLVETRIPQQTDPVLFLKTPGLLASNQSWGFGQSTPQRMPVFLISYAM